MNAGTTTLGTQTVTVVKTVSQSTRDDTRVTPQTWYFDGASNLPVRIEYRLTDQTIQSRFLPIALNLSSYQAVSGVLYPDNVVVWINGAQIEVLHLVSVQTNASISSSIFDVPAGGVQ